LFPDLNLTQVVFFSRILQFTSRILKSAVKEKDNTASRLNRDGNSRLANAQKSFGKESKIGGAQKNYFLKII